MQDTKTRIKEILAIYRKEITLISATIFLTAVLVIGFVYLPNANSGFSEPFVPVEFLEARNRAGGQADKIAGLISLTEEALEKIRMADINGDYGAGLAMIMEETERNKKIQDATEDLSEDLRDMAKYLEDVEPKQATEAGIGAVTVGIGLVQRLIIYNNNAEKLLSLLDKRFRGGWDEQTRLDIEELTSVMNEDARTINSLSNEYRTLMVQFDALTG